MPAVAFIDESLRQILAADSSVVAIVGQRIYSTQAPQGTAMPCVVYTQEQAVRGPFMHMTGMTGIARVAFTVACLGDTLLDSRNLARAVRAALQYKRTSAIRLATVKTDDHLIEPAGGGEQLPVYRTDITVEITYQEP